jgi:hypothetical protein
MIIEGLDAFFPQLITFTSFLIASCIFFYFLHKTITDLCSSQNIRWQLLRGTSLMFMVIVLKATADMTDDKEAGTSTSEKRPPRDGGDTRNSHSGCTRSQEQQGRKHNVENDDNDKENDDEGICGP